MNDFVKGRRAVLAATSKDAVPPLRVKGSGEMLYIDSVGNVTTARLDRATGHVRSIVRSNRERKDQSGALPQIYQRP